MKKTLSLIALPLIIFSCSTQNPNPNTNTNSSCTTTNYPTVTIGSQVWMQKNLDVDHYRNGDIVPQIIDSIEWANTTTGAWCYYNNDASNCSTYGKLYNWYAVNDSRGLAPNGWHIPSDAEWNKLVIYIDQNADTTIIGQSTLAGGLMKEVGTNHWLSPNAQATNSTRFSGLPGGLRYNNGKFDFIGKGSHWWSSTKSNTYSIFEHGLSYLNANEYKDTFNVNYGFSIRCVKD